MRRDPLRRLLWIVYPEVYDLAWDNRLTGHLAARVVGLIPPGLPVDEVGAGTGLFTRRLHQAGKDVRAFEPDARMRHRLASRLPGLDVCVSAIETLGDGGPEPRAVLAANVLHLAPDPDAALERLRRRAGRDGLVIAVAPTPQASLTRFCLALYRRGEPALSVLRFLSIHIVLAPLVALSGGLSVGRRSAHIANEATSYETVDGVAQLALFDGQPAERLPAQGSPPEMGCQQTIMRS